MKTEDVALQLAELCRQGEWLAAVNRFYADDIVSVEPRGREGMPAEMKGIEQVRGKTEWFLNAHEMHSCTVRGPFVARDTFVLEFELDATDKASNERMQMAEIGIYTVKDGKVAREEFLVQISGA